MNASAAVPLFTPLGVSLSEDGDDFVDLVPLAAWRDQEDRVELDENSKPILS